MINMYDQQLFFSPHKYLLVTSLSCHCKSLTESNEPSVSSKQGVHENMPRAPKKPPVLRIVFASFLSGKPKVYQGVRVKITVKELLQQRRARQAATGAAVSEPLGVCCVSPPFIIYLMFLPRL